MDPRVSTRGIASINDWHIFIFLLQMLQTPNSPGSRSTFQATQHNDISPDVVPGTSSAVIWDGLSNSNTMHVLDLDSKGHGLSPSILREKRKTGSKRSVSFEADSVTSNPCCQSKPNGADSRGTVNNGMYHMPSSGDTSSPVPGYSETMADDMHSRSSPGNTSPLDLGVMSKETCSSIMLPNSSSLEPKVRRTTDYRASGTNRPTSTVDVYRPRRGKGSKKETCLHCLEVGETCPCGGHGKEDEGEGFTMAEAKDLFGSDIYPLMCDKMFLTHNGNNEGPRNMSGLTCDGYEAAGHRQSQDMSNKSHVNRMKRNNKPDSCMPLLTKNDNMLNKQMTTESCQKLDKNDKPQMACKLCNQADEYIIEIELDSSYKTAEVTGVTRIQGSGSSMTISRMNARVRWENGDGDQERTIGLQASGEGYPTPTSPGISTHLGTPEQCTNHIDDLEEVVGEWADEDTHMEMNVDPYSSCCVDAPKPAIWWRGTTYLEAPRVVSMNRGCIMSTPDTWQCSLLLQPWAAPLGFVCYHTGNVPSCYSRFIPSICVEGRAINAAARPQTRPASYQTTTRDNSKRSLFPPWSRHFKEPVEHDWCCDPGVPEHDWCCDLGVPEHDWCCDPCVSEHHWCYDPGVPEHHWCCDPGVQEHDWCCDPRPIFYLPSWSPSHSNFFLQVTWPFSIFTPSDLLTWRYYLGSL